MADRDDLVRRLRAGQRDALEVLFHRHAEALWRFAWARTRSRADAADIVQETFLRAWRSADTYAGRASAATWLFAICRSAAIDHLRQQRRNARERAAEPGILRLVPAQGGPVDLLDGRDAQTELRRAIADLPAAQRDVVVLCDLCEFSTRDAAEVLGWKEPRVRVTLFRARRRLREMLASDRREARSLVEDGA